MLAGSEFLFFASAGSGDELAGVDAELGAELEQALLARLPAANQEISETAAAALGILGRESSALVLGALPADDPGSVATWFISSVACVLSIGRVSATDRTGEHALVAPLHALLGGAFLAVTFR